MKKFLGILVLGLLWCNTAFAKKTALSCVKESTQHGNTAHSIILDEKNKTIILDGLEVFKILEWNDDIIKFHRTDPDSGGFSENTKKILDELTKSDSFSILDRITGYYNNKFKCKIVMKTAY